MEGETKMTEREKMAEKVREFVKSNDHEGLILK